jgi:hypothetical protein
MLCDADAAPTRSALSLDDGRLAFLSRYHLENYFLNEEVLAEAFQALAPSDSWLRSPAEIRKRLRELASRLLAYAAALETSAHIRRLAGNVSILPKGCDGKSVDEFVDLIVAKAKAERDRLAAALSLDDIESYARKSAAAVQEALDEDTDEWKYRVPGKPVIAAFAKHAGIEIGMLKNLFIHRANLVSQPHPFGEIIEIFRRFSETV